MKLKYGSLKKICRGYNENYYFLFYPNKINIIIDIESVFADNSIHAHFSHCKFSSRSCTIIYVKKVHLERTITRLQSK